MIRRLKDWLSDEEGAIAPILVLLLIPIIGMVSLGVEVGGWYMQQRQLQNIADSAALAAAGNNTAHYDQEAAGVIHAYGWDAGSDFVITPASGVTCPTTKATDCYQVTVQKTVPLYLTQVVGYTGGGVHTHDGRMGTNIIATSIASSSIVEEYCMIGLGAAGLKKNSETIDFSGGMSGFDKCNMRSNGSVKCSSTQISHIDSKNATQACNKVSYPSTLTNVTYNDPFGANGISPRDIPTKINNAMSGKSCPGSATDLKSTLPQTILICSSNSTLPNALNITTANTVILVYNTTVNLNNFAITTSGAGTATFVFTGPGGGSTLPAWFTNTGSGKTEAMVTVTGAKGGPFQDFAIIEDPKYSVGKVTAFAPPANNAKWGLNLLGTVYAPSNDLDLQGDFYSSIGGLSCISLVSQSIQALGGKLTNNPADCTTLGYNIPKGVIQRQALVQ